MSDVGPSQHSLPLILSRELASNLATPMFVVDHEGSLVFYNESAERILGRPYAGRLGADEWASLFAPADLDGSPLAPADLPLSSAFREGRPGHRAMVIVGDDGGRREIEVTAFPLLGTAGRVVGAVAVFWERH